MTTLATSAAMQNNAAVLCSPGWWRPGEQSGGHAGSVDCGAVEYPDGRGGDEYCPAGQHEQAKGSIGGGAVQAPDVVQAGAAAAEHAVAQQGQGVGGGQDPGDGGEPAGQRGDREQRSGQEPGQDGHDRGETDVFLLGGNPVGQDLGDRVHEHCEQQHRAGEPGRPGRGDVEMAAAQPAGRDQYRDLQQADRDGDGHVAEHDQATGDGGGEQLAAGAAGPVDDHADAGERAGERDEQTDGADDDEGGVVAASGDHLGQCRGDDQGEQQRGDQRREDL